MQDLSVITNNSLQMNVYTFPVSKNYFLCSKQLLPGNQQERITHQIYIGLALRLHS